MTERKYRNASRYVNSEDTKNILRAYGHNFATALSTNASNNDVLNESFEVETRVGANTTESYQFNFEGAKATARHLLEEGAVQFVYQDGGYSGTTSNPTSKIVENADRRDNDDFRNFDEVFEEVLDGEVGDRDRGEGFRRTNDATGAVAVALSSIDRALDGIRHKYDGGDLHRHPASVVDDYDVRVAEDAVEKAFQSKSIGQKMISRLE